MKTNKNLAKKFISVLLLFAFLVSSFSGTVWTASAAETGVSYIERSWNASSKTVSSATKSAQATEVAANNSSWGQEGKVTYYVVNSAVTSTRDRIDVYGEVHLILNQKFSMPGRIVVPENGALHIHEALGAQNATLEIDYILSNGTAVAIHGGTVTTPRTYGVIRKGLEIRDGNFYLYSGTVNATIGKFSQASYDGSIFIYGGTVNAYTDDAMGLISADSGAYDAIEIYNATIKGYRTVESLRPLIGGNEVGKIIIHNSNVDVDYDGYEGTRGNQTHGIGGGSSDHRISEITITNSTVSVWGGGAGSGIGGYVDTITLKDSTVRAFSGDYSMPKGTGIGSRYCAQIIIDGGSVMTDTADENSDWTGKGYYAKNITIKKGTVDAHEGLHLNGGNMVITGGNVLGTINEATPVNNDGATLYARQITLTGAADGTAVSAVTGLPSYYNLNGMRTIGSDICVWVPSAHVPSVVSLGNDQYSGAMLGGEANQTATFSKLHTCADGNSDGLCDQCEELMPPSMENGFYLIYDLEDYQYLKKLVEGTLKSGLANRNANAKLMANIEIGSTTIGTADFPYGGVFDGNFKSLTVARRYETRNGTDPVAPFLYADGATFQRLTMEGSIYVDHYNRQIRTTDIGGFVAITTGNPVTFEQCINKASVEANNYTTPTVNLGGFVGMNYTTLTFNNCASLGTIKTSKASGGSGYVGNSAATSPVYANDCYIYLTMAVAGNNADANSYFCRNEDYTFLSNTYECVTMQRYNGNQGWINGHNNENKDGENDITSVEVAQINDGTVAYKLNKGNANGVWKQTLTGANPDQYPVFAGANVVPNITTGHYDNHTHNPTYELATVNVKNDSVRVSCAECAPDGMNITVSIEDGTTYIWYDKPEATITHPDLVDFYYMKGDTVLKSAPRDAGNYTVNFEYGGIKVSVPYSILPRSIENATVTSSGTLIYSGQPQSATFSVYDSGTLEEGVDYTLSNHQQTDAGTYEVTVTGIGNYTGTQTVKFSILKATNSWKVSPSIEDWTYGEEAKQPVYEAKYGTVVVRYTGETNGGEAYDSDKLPTQAGRYTATFTVTGENYTDLSSAVSFEIHKAALTVNADDKTITYGDAAPNYTVSYDGFVNGDDQGDLKGTLITSCEYAQFDDKGTYSIVPSGYTSDNYEITYKNGTLTVSPKPITVTIENQNSVYGQDIVPLTATTDGIVNNDQNVYNLATTATGTSNVGKYAITGTALDGNYDVTFVNGEYEITKREITITVDAKNTVVNTTLPTYTYKVEGLVGVDTLVTAPTLICNANIAVVGEYDITASGADAGDNYFITYVPAKLTVLADTAVDAATGYTEELQDYDPATVTSRDKAALEEMLSEIDTILADETTTDNGKKALEEVKEQVEKLIKEINDAAKATDTENTEKVENITSDNVAPENKSDLENAKADLEKALADNGGNYTADEKKAIQDEIGRIDEALKSIENAAAVDEILKALPESITPQNKIDEAIVREAMAAYDQLSDREKEILDEQNKEKLEQFVAIIAAGCKGIDTCPGLPYKDIDVKSWYHHDVDFVITNGYMIGNPDKTFAPDQAITRAEMVQILYNLEGRPAVSGRDAFGDTINNAWYAKAILWASQAGLVAGYGNGDFGPEDVITREQMISILWRYAKYKGIDVSTDESITLAAFADAKTVSRWALPAVKWAIQTKLIHGIPADGKTNINANGTATRAQAAAMLRRF
ncbi:MAG: S-layer homology domain-containing protein, partial [Clostridia bacterium]|nr:S-layer homology domain-containing protein [Clostridia bacterium]